MSGGGTTQSTQQSSVNQVQLPPWVNQAAQQNYAFAQNVAERPLQQYQGQMVADPGDQMQQAWNLAANSGNLGADQYNAAQAGYLSQLGSNAPTVTPQSLASTNLQPYMNPYTQAVTNTALPLMQQQLAQTQSGIGGQASQNAAFGGSRMGVQQGVAQSQGALNEAQLQAQLQQANFGQAQAAATGDITRGLQAAQGNQQAQLTQQGQNLTAAGGLTSLGQQAQANQARQFSELTSAGALEQQQAQNEINANMSKFNQAWNYPQQQMGYLLQSLGMTPYGQTQTGESSSTTQTQTSPDLAQVALGGLGTLGSMFGMGGPFGAGGGLAGLFGNSDRRIKKNITPLGPDPATGVPIHAFNYKGAPPGMPKTVGPMAQDVEKVFPGGVVHGPGGIKHLNLGALPPSLHPRGPGMMAPPGMGPIGTPPGPMRAPPGPTVMPRALPPRAMPMPPNVPPAPSIPGVGAGFPRGAPMGGGPAPGAMPGGMIPGALSSPAPQGTIGALGATMRRPRIRMAGPRMSMAGMGALGLGS